MEILKMNICRSSYRAGYNFKDIWILHILFYYFNISDFMIYDGVNCEHVLHWTLYSKAREFPKEKSSIKEIKDMIIRWTPLMLLRKTVLIHFLFYLPGTYIIFYISPIEYLISIWVNCFRKAPWVSRSNTVIISFLLYPWLNK